MTHLGQLLLGLTLLAATTSAIMRPANYTGRVQDSLVSGSQLPYRGGPILTGDIPVYLIMYGDWSQEAEKVLLFPNFVNHISNTPWWKIGKCVAGMVGVKTGRSDT